ncbi:endo-1,4-beta-xylanase [Paenibacillus sp. KS-LC4]|uniref:endo-1,4-beta-xylanase n=1 Tax=Paenibacillus sp. KS-LC4 TaxID=2979727 RepID=UPI0030D1896E
MTEKQHLNSADSLAGSFKNDFLIGAAVNDHTIVSQRELLVKHYNSLTAENEMKFESLHPTEDTYTFEAADRIAQFAREHGMKLRGHTLVWHNQTPDWVFDDGNGGTAERETLLARMKAHIMAVMQRYQDTSYCWDVVNEAVSDEGDEWLRPSRWLEGIGDDYMVKAFQFAHEADPAALLFYNDYNECNPAKREKIYRLVKTLLEQGAPIHGIGLQGHWNLTEPSLDDIRAAIERYASLGLKLQITEMDVSVFAFEDRRTDIAIPTAEMLHQQEQRYRQFFELFREYRDVLTGVTFWGAADDYTWLDYFPVRGRKNWPLLFDTEQQPKGAYYEVVNLSARSATE